MNSGNPRKERDYLETDGADTTAGVATTLLCFGPGLGVDELESGIIAAAEEA